MEITSINQTINNDWAQEATEPKTAPVAQSQEEIAEKSANAQQPATPMGSSGSPKVDILA